MSSRQLHRHRESDGLSLPERARSHLINQKWTNRPHHNPADLVQPSYLQKIQPPLQPVQLPELSPPHHKPLDSHKHQPPTQACCPEWAHHKYLCKIHKLQVPTFLHCLVLSLQKTGSTSAASRRYVTRKLQLSSVKTHKQDHQHILCHQGLDPLQQWTIPPKEIQMNQHTHLSWD